MKRLWRSRIGRLTLVIGATALALLALAGSASAQVAPPPAVSDQGDDIRVLFFVVLGIGVGVFVLVEAMILWVVFRYRRKSDDEFPTQVAHNTTAEVLWTVIPLIVVVALFIGSLVVLEDIQSAAEPGEAVVVVDVQGRQWAWAFNYAVPLGTELAEDISEDPADDQLVLRDPWIVTPQMTIKMGVEHMRVTARDEHGVLTVNRAVNGTVPIRHRGGDAVMRVFNGTDTIAEGRLQAADNTAIVTVPVGPMIRFNLASSDVLHAFYTPQFLYKLDAVPGRVQTMWVRVNQAGEFKSQCAEFCGRDHARMIFSVVALPADEYQQWFADKTPEAPERCVPGTVIEDAAASDDEAESEPQIEDCAFGGEADVVVETDDGGNPVNGQALFFELGCNVCHGDRGEGVVGPTIAKTVVPLERVRQQYRQPFEAMQEFPEDKVSDDEIADIYAWLQSVERPPDSEVIPSKLADSLNAEAGG